MVSGRGNGEEDLTIHAGEQSKKCEESWFHPAIEVYESFSVATQEDKAQFESILSWSGQRYQAQGTTECEVDWICVRVLQLCVLCNEQKHGTCLLKEVEKRRKNKC